MFQPNGEQEYGIYDMDKSNRIPVNRRFVCLLVFDKDKQQNQTLCSPPYHPAYIPNECIAIALFRHSWDCMLRLSLSFMHLKGLSLSQSTKCLFLLSFFNGNESKVVGFKAQKAFAAQVCLRSNVKTYVLCTKVCKLGWKCAALF